MVFVDDASYAKLNLDEDNDTDKTDKIMCKPTINSILISLVVLAGLLILAGVGLITFIVLTNAKFVKIDEKLNKIEEQLSQIEKKLIYFSPSQYATTSATTISSSYRLAATKVTQTSEYTNHLTKTTSPQKRHSLQQNQLDIFLEIHALINRIQMPHGWEKARTLTGDVYFIDHNTKTTTWVDPRIAIYLQHQAAVMYQKIQQHLPSYTQSPLSLTH